MEDGLQTFLIHAFIGFVVALAVFLLAARITGEQRFSLPTAPVLVGFVCGVAAHMLSGWATPVILVLYAAAALNEARQMRQAQDEYSQMRKQAPPENSG